MNLNKGDLILTAYADPAAGPGWANSLIWAIVRSQDGSIRIECLQPDEQTHDIRVLYRTSQSAHEAMTAAVRRALQ